MFLEENIENIKVICTKNVFLLKTTEHVPNKPNCMI